MVLVNILRVCATWPPRRRSLSVNYALLDGGDDQPRGVALAPLSTWDAATDTFIPATAETLAILATRLSMTPDELEAAIKRRETRLTTLAAGRGVGVQVLRGAVDELYAEEHGLPSEAAGDASGTDASDENDEDDDD